jgi:hypothetical protein
MNIIIKNNTLDLIYISYQLGLYFIPYQSVMMFKLINKDFTFLNTQNMI